MATAQFSFWISKALANFCETTHKEQLQKTLTYLKWRTVKNNIYYIDRSVFLHGEEFET